MRFSSFPRQEATPGAPRGARRHLRPWLAPLASALAAMALLLAPSLASADSGSSLTVVGTSDVSDSGLMQNVIEPAFKAAYPQFSMTYTGTATGLAIQSAESGNGGPSVLIVHAASLENQFVAGGYSYGNQYGYALFTNDFVLAGPTADPAGVAANGANNIAQAFADVATAGAAGHAAFLSRGGSATASGTTVEEHAVWALVQQGNLAPGVSFCTVSAADGGGASPTIMANNGLACPDSGTVTSTDAPPWYLINNGANQAGNVLATSACTLAGAVPNSCYSLTDRGTYDYLTTQANPANSGKVNQIPNLEIATRNNSATAPGGVNELINYFHAYIINPSAPNETVNVPAAQDFISLLTSPSVQSAISTYLSAGTVDTGGAPFKPDASPTITAAGLPATVAAGQPVTVGGQVTNNEPGYAPVAGQPITVDELEGGVPVPVASATTTGTGAYSATFTPASSGTYQVATGDISLLEIPSLNYGDILSPAASAGTAVAVQAGALIGRTTSSAGTVTAAGLIAPVAPDATATATLLARLRSSTGAFKVIGTDTVSKGQGTFAVNGALKGGAWTIEVQYADPGSLTAGTTAAENVTVPANAVKVSFGRFRNKRGKVKLSGRLSQGPTTTGATVKLFALSVGKLKVEGKKAKQGKKKKKRKGGHKRPPIIVLSDVSKGARFRQVAKVKVRKGHRTYTLRHTFARGHRYVLQLEYVHRGQTSTYSKYRYLNVH